MAIVILYLLKLSISLAAAWLFYQLFLRRLTFYNWNRWYLLGYSFLSFFIPLIHLRFFTQTAVSSASPVLQYIPVIDNIDGKNRLPDANLYARDGYVILLAILTAGLLFFLVRSSIRWFSLRRIRQQATLVNDKGIRIYLVDEPVIPFAFGNAIYINPRLHNGKEWEEIILHEYVHILQRHTIDTLCMELFCILNWYNPFCWLLRHAVRQNLEFIADQQVLEKGLDKKSYQYHLLKVIGEPRYRLANNFNISSLKKRIIMMNKIRSARLHLVKFLFMLPLLTVILVAFRQLPADPQKPLAPAASPAATRPAAVAFASPLAAQASPVVLRSVRPDTPRTDTVPVAPAAHARSAGAPSKDTLRGIRLRDTSEVSRRPLYVIDGVIQSDNDMNVILNTTRPENIKAIEVLKDSAATKNYGPKAANGVILIITKKDSIPGAHLR
jgi:TonB-dependent SusC/RagA subfamily outer membrane receptor